MAELSIVHATAVTARNAVYEPEPEPESVYGPEPEVYEPAEPEPESVFEPPVYPTLGSEPRAQSCFKIPCGACILGAYVCIAWVCKCICHTWCLFSCLIMYLYL